MITVKRISCIVAFILIPIISFAQFVFPTGIPTTAATIVPTLAPTVVPTSAPMATPTVIPTSAASVTPTTIPTVVPTPVQTQTPTPLPTVVPTLEPTAEPTGVPTEAPTIDPSAEPTEAPTEGPSTVPTTEPTPGPAGQAFLIEAEDYTGFSDTTAGNSGNCYRTDDVDIESCSEGGFNVGWVVSGEWLQYSVTVAAADNFTAYVRIACPLDGSGGFNLYVDGGQAGGIGGVPLTNSWQSWTDVVIGNINIPAGTHTLKIAFNGGFNFNYIYLVSAANPPAATPEPGTVLPTSTPPAGYTGPVAQYGQLKVSGKSLCDKNGTAIQLRGMCTHGIQWFPFVNDHTLPNLVYDWGIMIIRPAMYVEDYKNGDYWGGYVAHPDYMKSKVKELVDDAIALGIYVIIDWHIHNEPNNFISLAIPFYQEMATTYGSYPNVIYEICNEPEYTTWDSVKTYANQVIPAIRAIDPDNIILVGTATWCQDLDVAADAPLTGYTNIMYSLHFYAGTHQQWLRDKVTYALGKKLPVFCSEWGVSDSTGGSNGQVYLTEAQAWLDYLNTNKISWLNWNFSDKGEASAALLPGVSMGGPWTDAQLSTSGTWIKAKIK
jgi:aryl-phospho-beta-D-glucosidase BglC (GH1 family)